MLHASYLHSMSHLNANTELQCMYLHKVKECECLAQKLSKQTESVDNEVHNKLLKSFAKLEKHSISLELSLQHCKEQMKNNPVCKENASNVFKKEREQYHEIQDLKAQMQDKNMVINELKKLILVTKGKSVETQFDKPSVVRQPNAQRIPKPSVLGKPTPFSNSPEMRRVITLLVLADHSLSAIKLKISASKPKRKANKSVATPHKKTVASDTTIQKSKSYYKELYENTNQEWNGNGDRLRDGPSVCFLFPGYGDLIQGNVTDSNGVYYVECLNTIFSRLKQLHSIQSVSMAIASPTSRVMAIEDFLILTFDYITLLARKKDVVTGLPKFDICQDHTLYTWTLFLRSKDETPEVLKDFLTMIQRNLQAQVITVRTDRGTEFLDNSDLAPQRQEMSVENVSSGLIPQGQKVSDYDNSDPVPPRQNVVPSSREDSNSSQQGWKFSTVLYVKKIYNPTHDQS
ncbi:hypothetical protein Tco_0695377 [Tanacetum coccineum]